MKLAETLLIEALTTVISTSRNGGAVNVEVTEATLLWSVEVVVLAMV